jgi:hypothetical protein
MHRLIISISTSKYFKNLRDLSDFLDIKNASRKAIEARCRVCNYEIEFND